MVQTKRKNQQTFTPRKRVRTFGPVTALSTAPVAFGNSIRGSEPVVEMSANGCRVRGRDFGFQAGSTVAAATDWTLIGGMPLTPCAMPATALKNYAQMYSLFKINSLTVHYITSSPTSQAGDVLIYYERDRLGPAPDNTNTSFLPYVLSDAHTVLGPQWTNHSALIRPDPEFKSTDYGANLDINEESNGSVFLYSKTSAANSPGYIILDYDITFKQHQANPRAGLLPVARAQWTQSCFGVTTTAVVAGTTVMTPSFQGKTVAGVNATSPSGSTSGDIYKIIVDLTNSTVSGVNAAWTNATASNLFFYPVNSGGANLTLDDGVTMYGVQATSNTITLYPSITAAMTYTDAFLYQTTGTVTFNLCCYMSLVGFTAPRLTSY